MGLDYKIRGGRIAMSSRPARATCSNMISQKNKQNKWRKEERGRGGCRKKREKKTRVEPLPTVTQSINEIPSVVV